MITFWNFYSCLVMYNITSCVENLVDAAHLKRNAQVCSQTIEQNKTFRIDSESQNLRFLVLSYRWHLLPTSKIASSVALTRSKHPFSVSMMQYYRPIGKSPIPIDAIEIDSIHVISLPLCNGVSANEGQTCDYLVHTACCWHIDRLVHIHTHNQRIL